VNTSSLKQIIYPLALALLGLLIQGSLLRFALPNFTTPNLVLILVVFMGFFEASPLGAVLVFLIGLESDLCSGVSIGPIAGAYSAVFGVIVALSTRLFVESGVAVAISVFVSSLVSSVVYLLLGYQFSFTSGRTASLILWEATFTAVLAPATFAVLRRILITRRERPVGRLGSRQRLAAT
jgi:rod shape-determining protein MreD